MNNIMFVIKTKEQLLGNGNGSVLEEIIKQVVLCGAL